MRFELITLVFGLVALGWFLGIAEQDWLFNRDVTPGILGNYSETWSDYLAEWRDAGYLFKDGRPWYVQPWVRKAITPPTPTATASSRAG